MPGVQILGFSSDDDAGGASPGVQIRPASASAACDAAADLGVWMVNVHALGGRRMMEAAKEATAGARTPPLLVGVTILTSLGQDDLFEVGLGGTALDNVLRLAKLSHDAELDGVVCSPVEIKALRRILPERFVLVTPGIRPAGAESQDQKRVMTPGDAVARGTSYLVVGRPITRAERPMAALEAIEAEIRERSP